MGREHAEHIRPSDVFTVKRPGMKTRPVPVVCLYRHTTGETLNAHLPAQGDVATESRVTHRATWQPIATLFVDLSIARDISFELCIVVHQRFHPHLSPAARVVVSRRRRRSSPDCACYSVCQRVHAPYRFYPHGHGATFAGGVRMSKFPSAIPADRCASVKIRCSVLQIVVSK